MRDTAWIQYMTVELLSSHSFKHITLIRKMSCWDSTSPPQIHSGRRSGLQQQQVQTLNANSSALDRAKRRPLPCSLPRLDRSWCDFPLLTVEAVISQYSTKAPPTFNYLSRKCFCNHLALSVGSLLWTPTAMTTGTTQVSAKGFQIDSSILTCPSQPHCLLLKIKFWCQILLWYSSWI